MCLGHQSLLNCTAFSTCHSSSELAEMASAVSTNGVYTTLFDGNYHFNNSSLLNPISHGTLLVFCLASILLGWMVLKYTF